MNKKMTTKLPAEKDVKKEIISKLKDSISQDEAVKLLVDICSQNTINPPGNEYLVKDILTKKYEEAGLKVKTYEKAKGRTNVVGIYGSGRPHVAVVNHMDVVPVAGQIWKSDPFKPVVKNGKVYARGAQDNKGCGVAAYLGAKAFLKANPKFRGTLYVIATADEEQGDNFGMKYLLDKGFKFDYALVPDAGYMDEAVYGEKGILLAEVESRGKAFHGSTPSYGYNALWPLAELFKKLYQYDWEKIPYEKEHFKNGVVLNIGKMSGGIASNIVPDYATMTLNWRYPIGVKYTQILEILEELIKDVNKEDKRTKLSYKRGEMSIPYVSSLDSKIAVAFKDAAKELNMPMKFDTVSGQTTGKIIYHSGAEVIMHYVQSPGVETSHMPDEYIEIKNIKNAALLYALTLHKFFS